jgi:hypothetical protein
MNVKSGCEKAEARRRGDAALRRQTLSNTPFTNIKTCNGGLAEDNRSRAYESLPRHAAFSRFWLYMAALMHGYNAILFQPFLRCWRSCDGTARVHVQLLSFQPFLRFWTLNLTVRLTLNPPLMFQHFLRFWRLHPPQVEPPHEPLRVSTLLEILDEKCAHSYNILFPEFQPFLRFWIPVHRRRYGNY